MKKVNENKLKEIQGGFSTGAALGIAAAIIFISGIFEGIVHPKSCAG